MNTLLSLPTFYRFCKQHWPTLSREAQVYLASRQQIVRYRRNEVIDTPADFVPYLCIVMEGLVGGYRMNHPNAGQLRKVALPLDFFVTMSPKTASGVPDHRFIALRTSLILLIQAEEIHEARRLFTELDEWYKLFRERRMGWLRRMAKIRRIDYAYGRYELFRKLMPEVASATTDLVQAELLCLRPGQMKRLKSHYLWEG